MNPIFGAGPALTLRFAIVFVLSIVAMTVDVYTDSSKQIRNTLSSVVAPIQYIADLPQQSIDSLSKYAARKQFILDENTRLKNLQLIQNEKLQRYQMLLNENAKLRALLDTNARIEAKKVVAEIMAVANHPFSHNVLIDKGQSADVFAGQPVIDEVGVVGQVISTGNNTARVILLTDQTHAIPVRNLRNDIRAIVSGTGDINRMVLNNVPHDTDIKVGDKLITSGLGGLFPDGYPVAVVKEVHNDPSKPFLIVSASPVAQVNRLRHVLLLWPDKKDLE
ncbi:rod shape-determining protein MreC [Psychrosphaera haliotis]|uniref:Cell shape-determining protein MreC n=1 Tax=Psychrosphaera haliotis TaxID=555083 RepID=A0A6N8F8I3_9GAMM|nr:rod shape-determining protein MreC [Psychrosphaera haliotis]MUH72856.1 rod shape-determining protein MreC [Psychrosphaera haliotis]